MRTLRTGLCSEAANVHNEPLGRVCNIPRPAFSVVQRKGGNQLWPLKPPLKPFPTSQTRSKNKIHVHRAHCAHLLMCKPVQWGSLKHPVSIFSLAEHTAFKGVNQIKSLKMFSLYLF